MRKKRSFFERLTGTVRADDFDDENDSNDFEGERPQRSASDSSEIESASNTGQLAIDVINTPAEIVIRAMIAGVKPQDLDVQITRDMVTINGSREEEIEVNEEDYYHRELFWGSFSRNILLPEEVDVELAEAKEKHGLLEIHLPKIDRNRKTKLSVKSN
ncbi:MAG TPA: Hsp20/alpha crystallin family protein [Candidatus Paceibacterota bacterium]|nr:Hsp20/alpha crystallin family protein [Candidatus Paceibacterota bacterium]